MRNDILITGGSGFIGTNLVEYFYQKGCRVANLDIGGPKNKDHIQFWTQVDIRDYEELRKAITSFSPDYIIHLAARTDLNGTKLGDYSANTIGTDNLLKAISECHSLKKIIIASSMLVCKSGYAPKDYFDYCPTTIYGQSKVETERLVWSNKPICDWAIIRPTSIWGPWFDAPYKKFFDLIKSKLYFHIGRKSCVKTYGYIGNAIYQIEKLLYFNTSENYNKVFYIGDEPAYNIEEWADEIATELGLRLIRMPFKIAQVMALLGDGLSKIGVSFPMTTFRLMNMTTNNIIDLSETQKITSTVPYSRVAGIKDTLAWMNKKNDS